MSIISHATAKSLTMITLVYWVLAWPDAMSALAIHIMYMLLLYMIPTAKISSFRQLCSVTSEHTSQYRGHQEASVIRLGGDAEAHITLCNRDSDFWNGQLDVVRVYTIPYPRFICQPVT